MARKSILDYFQKASQSSVPKQAAPHPDATSRDQSATNVGPAQSSVRARRPSSPSPLPSSPPSAYPTMKDTRAYTAQNSTTSVYPPTTSQPSANNSFNTITSTSKRVVQDGEPVVLDSGSDTDSIPELNWPPPQKLKLNPKEPANDNGLRKPAEKKRKKTHDKAAFRRFVQDAQRDAEAERHIAQVKADLDKPVAGEMPAPNLDIDEELLASVVRDGDDPDKAKRLFLAMQRTNALHTNCVFYLFPKRPPDIKLKVSLFPMNSLPSHPWTSVFREHSTRNQAFMSGFAEHVFRVHQLPEELASWMIDQICISRDEALNDRYLRLLKSHEQYVQALLDVTRLSSIFSSIHVNSQCLDHQQKIEPYFEPELADKRPLPKSLVSVCRLLQTAASCLQTEARSRALFFLFHLCMDDSVSSDVGTLHVVQDTIEVLMCSLPDNKELSSILDKVVPLLLSRINHPVLQRQLVDSFPAKSPLTAYFQRHLALAFLLHPTAVTVPLDNPEIPTLIFEHLQKSPDYRVVRKTDYTSLAARLVLLEIAIGPGLLTVPYQPLLSPPPSQQGHWTVPTHARLTPEDKTFNKVIDALAREVERINDSIVETGGMTDLSRMYAKDYGSRLYHRLQNAIRIGGKARVKIFGDNNEVNFEVWNGLFKYGNKKTTQTVVSGGAVNSTNDGQEAGGDVGTSAA